MMHPKMKRKFSDSRTMIAALFLLLWVAQPGSAVAEAPPAAVSAFNSYIGVVESRLAEQHRAQGGFLAPLTAVQQSEARLRSGELIVERLSPEDGPDFSGAMLHDWRGTLFVPRAKAQDLERLLMDFNAHPKQFSPQVLQAKALRHSPQSARPSGPWMGEITTLERRPTTRSPKRSSAPGSAGAVRRTPRRWRLGLPL